jgi:hypothetical protein
LSNNGIIPLAWEPLIQIVGFIATFITILYYAIKLTCHITKVEDRITIESTRLEGKISNEATRLDGRINQLQTTNDIAGKDIYVQREEISKLKDYLLNNAQLLVKISEMSERGKTNVESDRTRKEKD